jgi:hypothetical protein
VSLSGATSPPSLGNVSIPGATNTSGQAFGTWTAGTVIGSGSLDVGNASVTGTLPVTLTAGTPYTVALRATPASLVVGNASSLKATVTDQFGNQVADGTLVTFTSSIGNVSPPTDTTVNGVAASSINSTQAGIAYITATSGLARGTVTVTFLPDVPATLILQANPTSQVVGNSSVLTATVRDQYNNAVANGTLVTFTTDLGNVMSPQTTTNGIATSSISATLVGTAHITATTGVVWNTTSVTFTPGTAYTLTLQANPVTQTVGLSSVLTATVTDRFGNHVANGTSVTITKDLGTVISPVTTTNGMATSLISSTQVGTAHITATSGLGQDTDSVTFVPDVPFSLTLQAKPITQTVGFSSVLTATVYDRFSNLVANNTSVTFAKDLAGTILSPVTTTNGIATSRVTITVASVAHITATSETAWNATAITFTPDAPMTITVQVHPPNLIANSAATAAITATVDDRFYNPVPGVALTGTVPITLGTVSGLGAANANGQAFGTWTAGTTVGSGLLRVGNGAITGTANIALLLSSPQTVTVEVISPTLFANSGMTTTVVATVRDAFANLIPNAAVNFGLAPSTLGSVTESATTDKNGQAFSAWTAGSVTGSGLVIASAGITASGSTAITLTADVPYTLALQADPTSPTVGIGSLLTATIMDRFSNPVANGSLVTFTSNLGAVLSPVTTTNGVASSQINWTLVGTVHITATSEAAQDTTTVNFVPDVPHTVTLQAHPTSPVVGNSSVLTTTVLDQYNNLVSDGTLVTFTSSIGNVSPSTSAATNGVVTSSISSTQAGVAYITATSGLAQGTITVTFIPDVPATLILQANPISQVVGNNSVLTTIVRDQYSNPVTDGTLVTFTTDFGHVASPQATTNGVATTSISTTLVGAAHITATSGLAQGTITVTFVPDVPATLILQANPISPVVGHSSALTVTVRDQYSNLVANGTLVTFTSSTGNVSTSTGATANGIVTSSISLTQAVVAYITATSGLAQDTVTVTFVPDVPATTKVQLSTDTLIVNSGTTATLTATVVDHYSNPVPEATLTGYISPTTLGSLSWQSRTTNVNGQAFGSWSAGTVPGRGVLVVNGTSVTITLAPRMVFLPSVMRNYPPTPVGTLIRINGGAANSYQIAVTLEASATVQGDYIEWMRFSNDSVNWGNWLTFAPTATWNLDPNNGLKTVYAQFKGYLGGVSAAISDTIFLFKNGDFSQPDLASWNLDPLNALSVSSASEPGSTTNPAGLLGNPAYACNNVPKGYGIISQYLIMSSVPAGQRLVLKFNYHIYTSDLNMGLIDNLDRFDVLLNNDLVFSDMNQDPSKPPQPYERPPYTPPATCTVYDLGRKEAVIPITGNPGSNIIVVFRLYNLPDNFYNTYVYLDNVRLEFQSSSGNYGNEIPALPGTPDGHTGR